MIGSNAVRAVASAIACLYAGCHFETGALTSPDDRGLGPIIAEPGTDPGDSDPPASPPSAAPAMAGMAAPVSPQYDASEPPPAPIDAGSNASDASTVSTDVAMDIDMDMDMGDVEASVPPETPDPGTPFSPCSVHSDCDAGLVCTAAGGLAPRAGYCTAFCGPGGTPPDDCPQPSSGMVKATCEFGTLCALGSCEQLQCPEGLHCVDTETPIGSGQVVHVYECQP